MYHVLCKPFRPADCGAKAKGWHGTPAWYQSPGSMIHWCCTTPLPSSQQCALTLVSLLFCSMQKS